MTSLGRIFPDAPDHVPLPSPVGDAGRVVAVPTFAMFVGLSPLCPARGTFIPCTTRRLRITTSSRSSDQMSVSSTSGNPAPFVSYDRQYDRNGLADLSEVFERFWHTWWSAVFFNIGLSTREKSDLVAFLRTL
jgi:hypothetical protein